MVQQEIIIQMAMHCNKCRSKAMRILPKQMVRNVISVAIRRPERDWLEVIGEGVDPAELTCSLRRKFCTAAIVSVQGVSNAGITRRGTGYYSYDDHEHGHQEGARQYSSPSSYVPYPQYPVYEAVHHVPNPPSVCTIMSRELFFKFKLLLKSVKGFWSFASKLRSS
ncbi:hypothetical protein ACJRO7_023847 [Eucalyptus globulus]|uniref:Uncharacterized protein n=1 Tax=Eucalyptus globulus TaxID=34317 RepID=A0ABD3K3S9_EUCGL